MAKDRGGAVEALRVLRTTRKGRGQVPPGGPCSSSTNTIVAAPDEVRDQVRNLTRMRALAHLRGLEAGRRGDTGIRRSRPRLSLKSLARRILDLDDEITELDRFIAPLVEELAPDLLKLEGVGTASAGELLVTAGENPDRLRSEASFAMLCGACPLPASSGKTRRHRLNRGGNRQANSALHIIVLCRMRTDPRTRTYVERRTGEGLSKREVMRCLKTLRGPRNPPRPHRPITHLTNMRASKAANTRPTPSAAGAGGAGVRPSTGSVGDAYDNALCESFFATLECELIRRRVLPDAGRSPPGGVPVHRGLVQSLSAAFKPRLRVPGQLRSPVAKGGGVKTGQCPDRSGAWLSSTPPSAGQKLLISRNGSHPRKPPLSTVHRNGVSPAPIAAP